MSSNSSNGHRSGRRKRLRSDPVAAMMVDFLHRMKMSEKPPLVRWWVSHAFIAGAHCMFELVKVVATQRGRRGREGLATIEADLRNLIRISVDETPPEGEEKC